MKRPTDFASTASGSSSAAATTQKCSPASSQRRKNGAVIPGLPPVYAVVTLPDFEIVDTWDVGGLRGSGSHDVKITNVEVPNERILAQMGRHHDRSPLEHFPLGSRLAYNKVGVALGIARAAVDAFTDIATGKVPRFTSNTLRERPFAQRALAQAEVRVRAARCARVRTRRRDVDEGPGARPDHACASARCSRSRVPTRWPARSKRWKPSAKRPARPRISAAVRSNASRATSASFVSTSRWRRSTSKTAAACCWGWSPKARCSG